MGQNKIEHYEGKTVNLIYEGSDLTNGKIKRVGKSTTDLETDEAVFELYNKEIQTSSIKIIIKGFEKIKNLSYGISVAFF